MNPLFQQQQIPQQQKMQDSNKKLPTINEFKEKMKGVDQNKMQSMIALAKKRGISEQDINAGLTALHNLGIG